jgi:hypothetical protein
MKRARTADKSIIQQRYIMYVMYERQRIQFTGSSKQMVPLQFLEVRYTVYTSY